LALFFPLRFGRNPNASLVLGTARTPNPTFEPQKFDPEGTTENAAAVCFLKADSEYKVGGNIIPEARNID